ncbi:MAG: ribosome small subunit-dependent GTPase A [Planctomycetes bacterium]|nr:ribosome small subunit-dependent GTPase A [Planctomycetota bacterium]
MKTPAVVGDRVVVRWSGEDRGAIDHLEPRRDLSAPARARRCRNVMAANADRVAIVSAAADPIFNPALVDRILAVVEFSHLDAIVVVNKLDLVDEEPEELDVYRELGYAVVATSVVDGRGIEALRDELAGRVTVVTGHSGVGKSSLLNAKRRADLGLAVGDVNEVTGRGTHTTTASTWVDLDVGGAVIDTAGIREFGLFGIPKREVPWLFRDIAKIAPECRYPDCSHTHEPGCAVLIIEDGRLARLPVRLYTQGARGRPGRSAVASTSSRAAALTASSQRRQNPAGWSRRSSVLRALHVMRPSAPSAGSASLACRAVPAAGCMNQRSGTTSSTSSPAGPPVRDAARQSGTRCAQALQQRSRRPTVAMDPGKRFCMAVS